MFNNIYKNKKVLVTGHTGFKGSWLALWLQSMGATVTGIALPPVTSPAHWDLLKLDMQSFYLDVRNIAQLKKIITQAQPDIVFHLAAQPLVRHSYENPLETWSTNVMGTANVLDCCRQVESIAAIVVVTSDKCYENKEWPWGYREVDELGGHDPYSASKAGSELVVSSYRKSFFNRESGPLLASARAGNVIGGGDWSNDRLVPDLARSVVDGISLEIRSPNATRPWQHVLECLSGYLVLGQNLLERHQRCDEAWNFGPAKESNHKVSEVLKQLKSQWPEINWHYAASTQSHAYESQLLHLDSSKANDRLSWAPVWTFEEGVNAAAQWYKAWLDGRSLISTQQLASYIARAEERKMTWALETVYAD